MLRSDLCDYSDAFIIVKGRATAEGYHDDKIRNKKLILTKLLHLGHVYKKIINNTF